MSKLQMSKIFNWLFRNYDDIGIAMKSIYQKKLLPLEKISLYNELQTTIIDDTLFDAKPMILVFGQYSTGKTTFIQNIIGKEFPGMWIGPEPTTDRFMAVMGKHDTERESIPGNALVMNPKFPFQGLTKFGSSFLNRFQGSFVHSPFLNHVTIVDTPGLLSGEKQRLRCGYDFQGVLRWFAERSDRILLIFDVHKLDVSDELRCCIEALIGHQEKMRILLNKADLMDHHHLIKVYGSLMWSLGKIMPSPEASKVYLGSFWDQPIKQEIYKELFENDRLKLYEDLQSIPQNSYLRKINDFIKRAHQVKAHALIMSSIYDQYPRFLRYEGKKLKLINHLPETYEKIQSKHSVSPEFFPNILKMQNLLRDLDFSRLNKIKSNYITKVDIMLKEDIAGLMSLVDERDRKVYETDEHASSKE